MKKYLPLALLPLLLFGCGKEISSGKLRLQPLGKFDAPVYATGSGGELYIVEQAGRIIRMPSQKVFLDIRDQVVSGGEQGLLSLALSPRWKQDRLFYIYYTDRDENQVVAEGQANPRGTRGKIVRTVLEMEDPAPNHNGGQILFGPGGLFVGTGDGGGSGDPERAALDLQSLLGKILRIDPRGDPYSIPKDNPFLRGGGRPEIFSYGLRNPWRFSIGKGRIWIADVGQGDREEISAPTLLEARGRSFGWSRYEGSRDFNKSERSPRTIFPVWEYGHTLGRCSVTGGYIAEFPRSLRGRYVYGDYCSGEVRSFRLRDGKAGNDRSEGLFVSGLASFAKIDGELLLLSNEGEVYRLEEK